MTTSVVISLLPLSLLNLLIYKRSERKCFSMPNAAAAEASWKTLPQLDDDKNEIAATGEIHDVNGAFLTDFYTPPSSSVHRRTR
uniref:Uncharacterized protein n=1 Tax=Rhipicephalus appendiculatus TaxID=34631 RepID=A0A131YET4_RHIAP